MRLVKQTRVVTKSDLLVGNIRSQSLHERLFSKPYRKIFRYDPLNRMLEYCIVVPLYRKNLLQQLKRLYQGADHVRTYNLSRRQRRQRKCVLNGLLINKKLTYDSSSLRRYYSCKVNNRSTKIDASINNASRQDVGDNVMENQGDLNYFKKEILSESENLTPLLIKSIDKGIWPISKFNKEIRTLVKKRQKYLAMLSNQYGFRSATVIQQVDEWLTKLDLRVFAIESVYKSSGNIRPRVDNLTLKRENLLDYLEILKYKNLKHYKVDRICRIHTPKGNDNTRLLGIPTIKDQVVQTLFVQVLEPIIDVHADNNSFGFRKGRNPHQAIGLLSKLLHVKPAHQRRHSDKRYFTRSKYILNINIEKFFDKVNHDWLVKNYPFPDNFINILKEWLSCEIICQGEYETSILGFPQGSIIGPSFVNFTLNGLEKTIVPSKVTIFDEEKFNYYISKGLIYDKNSLIVRKTLISFIVRYGDEFTVIVNDKQQTKTISDKINIFLQERGLSKNLKKSKVFKWAKNTKFDYLGFTFHYILGKRFSKITTQRKYDKNFVQSGLHVYPSKLKVQFFKNKIKETIKSNLNASPYRLINILNPIIRDWKNYFVIGTLRIFSRLDYYIWYRIWRYLRRKYKKVSTKNLVKRYFQGVQTPSGRTWQFHGTFNSVNKEMMKRKESVAWVLLLSQFNKSVPAQMFSPSKVLVKSTYYIDDLIFNEYNLRVVKLCSKGKKC